MLFTSLGGSHVMCMSGMSLCILTSQMQYRESLVYASDTEPSVATSQRHFDASRIACPVLWASVT